MKERLEIENSEKVFRDINKFHDLFDLLHKTTNFSEQYKEAYEEAAELAKSSVEKENKEEWNSSQFARNMKEKYPNVSQDFISTLERCIDGYNPPVNLPSNSLWEQ